MRNAPRIRIESGEQQGTETELSRSIVIGRAKTSDLVLHDESCSRMHVRITPEGGRARVEDLGSTNGTLVNGTRVTVSHVESGDTIVVGDTTLRFHCPPDNTSATVILSPSSLADAQVTAKMDPAITHPTTTGPRELINSTLGLIEACRGTPLRPAVAQATVDQLIHLLSADRCVILLFRHGSSDPFNAHQVSVPDVKLDPNRPWISEALETKQALLLKDKLGNGRSLHCLVIPTFHGEIPQMLVYADRRRSPFSESDMDNALHIVRIATSLMDSARVHEHSSMELEEHRARFRKNRRIVGESPAHLEVVSAVRRHAELNNAVLFIGETGTGKELFARLLHDLSPRAEGAFVTVNCSATPEGLLDTEIFGGDSTANPGLFDQERPGALELAHGGTIFLDEIDALDLPSQARLASVLRNRLIERRPGGRSTAIDVRLVAASDRNLSSRAQTGSFHEDLLALLALSTIPVHSLREHREDIPLLADHFLKTHARRMNRQARRLSGEALQAMLSYAWPGNVRELSNVIQRAVILSEGEEVGTENLPLPKKSTVDGAELSLECAEKVAIERALAFTNYKKGKATQLLGISWPTLNKKIALYGIEIPGK